MPFLPTWKPGHHWDNVFYIWNFSVIIPHFMFPHQEAVPWGKREKKSVLLVIIFCQSEFQGIVLWYYLFFLFVFGSNSMVYPKSIFNAFPFKTQHFQVQACSFPIISMCFISATENPSLNVLKWAAVCPLLSISVSFPLISSPHIFDREIRCCLVI